MAVVRCVMDLAKRPNDEMLGQRGSWSLKQAHYTADNSHSDS
jgi:hypothetical protein